MAMQKNQSKLAKCPFIFLYFAIPRINYFANICLFASLSRKISNLLLQFHNSVQRLILICKASNLDLYFHLNSTMNHMNVVVLYSADLTPRVWRLIFVCLSSYLSIHSEAGRFKRESRTFLSLSCSLSLYRTHYFSIFILFSFLIKKFGSALSEYILWLQLFRYFLI